jgi:hypothetical protein
MPVQIESSRGRCEWLFLKTALPNLARRGGDRTQIADAIPSIPFQFESYEKNICTPPGRAPDWASGRAPSALNKLLLRRFIGQEKEESENRS